MPHIPLDQYMHHISSCTNDRMGAISSLQYWGCSEEAVPLFISVPFDIRLSLSHRFRDHYFGRVRGGTEHSVVTVLVEGKIMF